MSKEVYQIRAALGTTDGLTGQGEEWIIDPSTGETLARFWNGNFVTHTSHLSLNGAMDGPTLILEAA
jgi:hypothetical protein